MNTELSGKVISLHAFVIPFEGKIQKSDVRIENYVISLKNTLFQ